MASGLVFDIQRYCTQDGPGIRTTVFLKGCPASCPWCHNPESQSTRPEIIVLEKRCLGCGVCLEACPHGLLVSPPEGVQFKTKQLECTVCGACVEACPSTARQMVGTTMTESEVMREVLKDRIFYDDSSGGVTFSGGEPLLQATFLKSLLVNSRSSGIHTAVDTCGFAPQADLLAIAPMTDLFLYDLKIMDSARHREFTGIDNKRILENLKALGQRHGNIWVRIPVIPGFNDDPDNLEATARFAAEIEGVRLVNLLPYHRNGAQKFQRVGKSYTLSDVAPPTSEYMQELAEHFRGFGLKTKTGG